MQWVDHRLVEQIILLDAMYAGEHAFDAFIGNGKRADQHKLIVVGADTAEGSAGFAKKYQFAVVQGEVLWLTELAATFGLLDAYEGQDFARIIRQVVLESGEQVWACQMPRDTVRTHRRPACTAPCGPPP
jgi:hypothetical protein